MTPGQWKYDILIPKENVIQKGIFGYKGGLFQNGSVPQLKGSDELWPLVRAAIKDSNKENALKVVEHIKYFGVGDIHNYRVILKVIKKAFREIDITDLL